MAAHIFLIILNKDSFIHLVDSDLILDQEELPSADETSDGVLDNVNSLNAEVLEQLVNVHQGTIALKLDGKTSIEFYFPRW